MLDARIHRVLKRGLEISNKPEEYSIKLRIDGADNYLDIKAPASAAVQSYKCEDLFKPDAIGVKILVKANDDQHWCDLEEDTDRTIELGRELSANKDVSIIFVHGNNSETPTQSEFILFSDTRTKGMMQKYDAGGGGEKIPPNTG